MNYKRFALCSLLGFAFVFIFEFIVHGIFLVPTYELTAELWRPTEEMNEFFPLILTTQLLTTAILCFIYTRHHEGKGIREGLRFGVMVGLVLGVSQLGAIAYMPISIGLGVSWMGAELLKTIILGALFSLLYRK